MSQKKAKSPWAEIPGLLWASYTKDEVPWDPIAGRAASDEAVASSRRIAAGLGIEPVLIKGEVSRYLSCGNRGGFMGLTEMPAGKGENAGLHTLVPDAIHVLRNGTQPLPQAYRGSGLNLSTEDLNAKFTDVVMWPFVPVNVIECYRVPRIPAGFVKRPATQGRFVDKGQ